MKRSGMGILMITCLFFPAGAILPVSHAATSFNGSTIIGVNQAERTITFRTKEGDKWTLPVDDPELLKGERIAQGDQVSIEIGTDDRITKILKPSDQPRARNESSEEANQ